MERGHTFYDPQGYGHFLVTTILLWLGDHEELNALASMYAKACRICYLQLDEDGEWIYRSKERTNKEVSDMEKVALTSKKQKAFEKAKLLQKHIEHVSVT